ncbi:MAG TPA: cysteine--tRNA ligase [Labilithrix sp.]|nr:cysteine--tRNA ligase [Labilithrix sp.]
MQPSLALYDNFTRSLRPFEPLEPDGPVGLYTCGPTVYDYQHIGNHRTFLFEDILKRVLVWNGYRVKHVMNVTDVGHLVSDADEGEDKMEKGARRTGRSAWEIAELYTQAFLDDLNALHVVRPDVLCRATDHIPEQIAFIHDIEAKGFTYRTADGIYFDTSRQPSYGELARRDKSGLQAGKRVAIGSKRSSTDFALWKFSPSGAGRRQMEWDSPWGRGFPGWHIECSAMAQKYLGDFFDIHCGGEDHLSVHHTNEIAQTEARAGTRLANFWLHGYFLVLPTDGEASDDGKKMSKSDGDFLRVATLVERGVDPVAYRYLCLTAHYRTQLTFTWEALDAAKAALTRLRSAILALPQADVEADPDQLVAFTSHLNADLNVSRALALVWETLRGPLREDVKRATIARFDEVLGLGLATWRAERDDDVPARIEELAEARQRAREARVFAEADRYRAELRREGWEIEDLPGGYRFLRRS